MRHYSYFHLHRCVFSKCVVVYVPWKLCSKTFISSRFVGVHISHICWSEQLFYFVLFCYLNAQVWFNLFFIASLLCFYVYNFWTPFFFKLNLQKQHFSRKNVFFSCLWIKYTYQSHFFMCFVKQGKNGQSSNSKGLNIQIEY